MTALPHAEPPPDRPSASTAAPAPPPTGTQAAASRGAQDFGSLHSHGFPELLRRLDCSLLASTYQANKLVVLRAEGETIETTFSTFHGPMGIAADRDRLAVGSFVEISEFRNAPSVASRLHQPPRHDVVFLARRAYITGAIDIHEMAWDADGRLWFVNTLFSCLCTLDTESSFVPRWRPPFVSHYAPEDRCHLNGVGMRDGRPRYVTALGTTNTHEGWRGHRSDGGVLIDIASGATIADGLSMPHSPRWHDGRIWVLESGRGALVAIDPVSGARTDVARVPGFARGLDFVGAVAFIGLSQQRESNTLSPWLQATDGLEKHSGVWAVHIGSGETLGLLRFTGDVREIFAIQALRGVGAPLVSQDMLQLAASYALPEAAMVDVASAS